MEILWDSFFANPLFYTGALLAGVAASGFVLCMAGFFPGVVPAVKESGHIEHLSHQRTYVAWGLLLMIAAWSLWQAVLFVASGFSAEVQYSKSLLTTAAVFWALFFIFYQFSLKQYDTH
jgi:hypothetical protein